jgi:D-apionolactonase
VAPLSGLIALHGRPEPLQVPTPLRAGPVTAALDGVDLRYVRIGDVELVRRIYVAVRDRNWNTIPGVASEVISHQDGDAFAVRFSVRHTGHDTDFSWEGAITGDAGGTITFAMDGRGERPMLYNRIGFCVLHPWRELGGARYRGETPQGPVTGEYPRLVAPQRFENGVYVPLFDSVSRLEIALTGGGDVTLAFDGDLFETEDQRNWTDSSFKTYCTPLALGFPHRLAAGERRHQAVTVSARAVAPATAAATSAAAGGGAKPLHVSIGEPAGGTRVCDVGLALPAGRPAPSAAEAALLRALGPAHVRHELHLEGASQASLAAAIAAAAALGARLELALFVPPLPNVSCAGLTEVATALRGADLARVLVAVEGAQTTTPDETTPGRLVDLVRQALQLGSEVAVAGGTDMYFCELNRTRPDVAAMDGVFWSMNAQAHAFDDLSVMETPEAQGAQVRTARGFAPDRALFAGPISLRRRYNVNATVAEAEADESVELPDSVDPRQLSLLGAAWTLASLAHISQAGAASGTWHETVGWRGVIQGDTRPPLPEAFPAPPGSAFPLFHVLADGAELRGAEILACDGVPPLQLAALAARRQGGGVTVLLANLTAHELDVSLTGPTLPDGAGGVRARRLNAATVEQATRDPLAFRAGAATEGAQLTLTPYETVRIDTSR